MTTQRTAKKAARNAADRIEALAILISQAANADAELMEEAWGTAGSLGHVAEKLAELADFLTESEEGTHANTSTDELRGDAAIDGFPGHIDTAKNGRYYLTGKEGNNTKTGRRVAEYANADDARLWADGSGRYELD